MKKMRILFFVIFLLTVVEIPDLYANGSKGPFIPLILSLKDFVELVREKNEQIQVQDAEWTISKEAVTGARAIFEPAFVGNYEHMDLNRRNTVVEQASLVGLPEFHEQSNDYEAAVEAVIPTGGRFRFGYNLRAFSNNLDQAVGIDEEYRSFLGANFTQPLFKGGGIKTTMAEIRVAEAGSDIAFQTYREMTMRVISEAIDSYWDLYSAQEKHRIRKDSAYIAEEFLRDNIARVKTGKMAETEVLEARAGLALRKSLVSEAEQGVVSAMNNVRNLFSSSVAETEFEILAGDKLQIREVKTDFSDSLIKAFKLRPEYLASRKKIEQEDIKLAWAKNQRWPQLDLKASYGLNGLAETLSSSWDDLTDGDFKTWSIGVELRIPVTGDKRARSEVEVSRQRKKQALLEIKAVEVAMANAVNTALRSVHSAREQVKQYASAVEFNQRLLDAEAAKFRAGKSNSRLLLEREENLIRAREAELDALVNYEKVIVQLELAQGSLLLSNGIEIMEVEL
jgi:outer membrane protein TolC